MWPKRYKTKSGAERYLIMDRDASGDKKVKIAGPFDWTSQRDADEHIRLLSVELPRTATPGGRSERTSVVPRYADWSRIWLDEHLRLDAKDSTRARYENMVRVYLNPYFGPHKLDEISPKLIKDWMRTLLNDGNVKAPPTPSRRPLPPPRPLSNRFVNQLLRVLDTSLQRAASEGHVTLNPARSVDRLRVPKTKHGRVVDTDLIWELANKLGEDDGGRYRVLVLLAAYCGLRIGELGALREDDIDLVRQIVHVRRTLAEVNSGYYIDTPKTTSSEADVPIPDLIMPALRWHMANHVGRGVLVRHKGGLKWAEDVVFTSPRGKSFNPNSFRRDRWHPALKSLGVATRLRPHDLRHTMTTNAHKVADSPTDVRDYARHSSLVITDGYSHSGEEERRAMANRLPGPSRPELADPSLLR